MKRLDEREFRPYVNQQVSAHQRSLSREAMDELMQRLPLDLESFHQELIKLTLFGTKISRDDIVHLVSRPLDEDVFHLVNAVITHDLKQAMHLWHDLDSLEQGSDLPRRPAGFAVSPDGRRCACSAIGG